MQTIKLLIIDDSAVFLDGLHRFLSTQSYIEIAGEFQTGRHVLDDINTLKPDVVITDLAMPEVSGFAIIDQIRHKHPDVGVVALSMHNDQEYRLGALRAKVHAYVAKSELKENLMPAIVQAYETVKNCKWQDIIDDKSKTTT